MSNKLKLKAVIINAALIIIYIAALMISSGLTRIVMAILLIMTLVCAFLNDNAKRGLLMLLFALFIPLSLYANTKEIPDLQFYQTTNQSIYQPAFYEQQINPDAYVRELIRDKTVIVPYELKTYSQYDSTKEEDREESFSNRYFRENNYVRYFNEYAKECLTDDSLPNIDTVYKDKDLYKDSFASFGCANDMLRYSFLLNREPEKEMSYFWYSWFYYSFAVEKDWYSTVYVNTEGIEASDRLVAIWDRRENLYLMSEDYYLKKVKK